MVRLHYTVERHILDRPEGTGNLTIWRVSLTAATQLVRSIWGIVDSLQNGYLPISIACKTLKTKITDETATNSRHQYMVTLAS